MAAQPTPMPVYALHLPAVQGPPRLPSAIEQAELVPTALPSPTVPMITSTPLPTITPLPTDTPLALSTPEMVAMAATQEPPAQADEVAQTATPQIVMIVITPQETPELTSGSDQATWEATGIPLVLPAAPPTAAFAPQLGVLAAAIIGAGVLIALPLGLFFVVLFAYWVGRKL
jgi:hypothetical protein